MVDTASDAPTAASILEALGLEAGQASCCAAVLWMLAQVPSKAFDRALERIGNVETLGPIFDPTGFMRLNHEGMRKNADLLRALRALRRQLPEEVPHDV